MQTRFSRRIGLQLLAVAIGLSLFGCHTTVASPEAAAKWQAKTVYTRVGMKVEPARRSAGWHMYSTNHIGLPKHIKPGTKFTVHSLSGTRMDLGAEDGSVVQLEFVQRSHPDLTFDAWLDRQISMEEVELPGDLSSEEEEAIEAGRYEIGMSREALFLAIGYPPGSLTPSPNDTTLTYEIKRFNKIVFTLDAEGKLASILD